MKKTIIIIMLFLVPAVVEARIGENRKECEARYGLAVKESPNYVTFKKGGMEIMVRFMDSKVAEIIYSASADILTVDATLELMKINSNGIEWKLESKATEDEPFYTFFTVDKNQRSIVWAVGDNPDQKKNATTLRISTKEFQERIERMKAEKMRKEGF